MKTKGAKILLFLVAAALLAALYLPTCKGVKHKETVYEKHLKRQNDSLKKNNLALELDKSALRNEIETGKNEIILLKKIIIKKEASYQQTKKEGRIQLVNNPCDSIGNIQAYDNLATACDSLNAVKDSTIERQDTQIAKHEKESAIQEQQLDNYKTIMQGQELIANHIESENKGLIKRLRWQKIKTVTVAIVGAAATAFAVYLGLVK